MNDFRKILSRLSLSAIIIVLLVSLYGWLFDIEFYKSYSPNSLPVMPNALVCFILLTFTLIFISFKQKKVVNLKVVFFLLFIVIILSTLTLLQDIFSVNFNIDQIVFSVSKEIHSSNNPGRMAPMTAVNFILLSVSFLMLITEKYKNYSFFFLLTLFVTGVMALLTIIGYVFYIIYFRGFSNATQMPFMAALLFILIISVTVLEKKEKLNMLQKIKEQIIFWAIPVVLIIGILIFFTVRGMKIWADNEELVIHTLEVKSKLDELHINLNEAVLSSSSFALTEKSDYEKIFEEKIQNVFNKLTELKKLISDNPEQLKNLNDLKLLVYERLNSSNKVIEITKTKGRQSVAEFIGEGTGQEMLNEIQTKIVEMDNVEAKLIEQRNQAVSNAEINTAYSITFGGIFIIAIFIFAFVIIKNELLNREKYESIIHKQNEELEERVKIKTLQLNEALELNKSILDNAGEGIYGLDLEGKATFVNKAAVYMLGYSEEELIGNVMHYNHHYKKPDGSPYPHEECFIYKALADGLTRTISDEVFWKKDGSAFSVEYTSSPIIKNGSIIGTVVVFSDISERVKNETALKKSEERYRSTLDNLQEGCQIIGFDWEYIYINKAAEIQNRCPSTELIGNKYMDMWPGIEKTKVFADIKRCLEERISIKFDNEFTFPDGKTGWFNLSIEPIPEGAFIMSSDITERKLAENKIRAEQDFSNTILDSIPGILYLYDSNFNFLRWNKNFEIVSEYSSEEISRMKPLDFFADDQKELLIERIGKVFTSGYGEMETDFITKSGKRKPYFFNGYKFTFNETTCLIGVGIDIAERKKAEAEIIKLNEELEQKVIGRTTKLQEANKELEAFSYSVSHDLRAPLRHISGFIELLKKNIKDTDEKSKRYTNIISEASSRMGLLIDDLLQFSRIGRAELNTSSINCNSIISELLIELKPEYENRKIKWEIPTLPLVTADYGLLKQVWANLLSNSIKYTGTKDEAIIQINFENKEKYYQFSITDNGVGFDMQYYEKLFGVFQRLHAITDFSGTGIGLANVKRIIDKHGGKVWAVGEVDKGATFFFTLPEC